MLGPLADAAGNSAQSLAIHPSDPALVYVLAGQVLFRGRFPALPSTGPAVWTQLPGPPQNLPGTSPSGSSFVVSHVTPEGKSCLIVSDRSTTHIFTGEPAAAADWHRIEDGRCHLDPHGFSATPQFRPHIPGQPEPATHGRALLINDGGANVTVDGGRSWINATGLSTLDVVNVAVNAAPGKPTTICIGTGDNRGFSSRDGAGSWKTQHYDGGDNDCAFSDPLQPERMVVFAPRLDLVNRRLGCLVYTGPGGDPPNVDAGTQQAKAMGVPPFLGGGDNDPRRRGHNLVSFFANLGYRPLILTCAGESPRPDGDFVLIRFTAEQALLLRTTHMSDLPGPEAWVTDATSEAESTLTFRQGPPLPNKDVCTVQASGGHAKPVYYVGDQFRGGNLWKWTDGMPAWKRIVNADAVAGPPGPDRATRYFVDPYRPSLIYVLSDNGIWRSENGGAGWVADEALARAMSEDGAFPFDVGRKGVTDGTPGTALLRDMQFDPLRPECRFAIGPAGVFHTRDGRSWTTLVRASALAAHTRNARYDPVSCPRSLYVATYERGLLRLSPIPPDWDFPVGSLQATSGRITLLRVHDPGTGFGPPGDRLDTEVIVELDSEPEKAFGITLRRDADELKSKAMLDLLRDAFGRDRRIGLEFVRSGCRTARIVRVIET